jgi:hypothetical protein
MDQTPNNQDDQASLETLENQPTVVEAPSAGGNTTATTPNPEVNTPKKPRRSLRDMIAHSNIYLIIFILLLVLMAGGAAVLYVREKNANKAAQNLGSQTLSTDDLNQLANNGVTVGDPKQVLTVQSNAIFAGKMLVRSDLEVAGKLLVGSSLSLTGITVAGNSVFDDVQITKSLSVNGNTAVQGKISAQSIATSGNASFGGLVTASQLATNSLTLNGDLVLTRHIAIGGASPSRSNGGAVGSGGTTSVSGSDAAGSITVNTGGSPSAGCFITVNFTRKYNTVPRVLVTPVGSGAGNVNYYVTRTTSSFSVCGTVAAGGGQSFGFDYFVVE